MKQTILLVFILFLVSSCEPDKKTSELVNYYPFSITKIVNHELNVLQNRTVNARKTVIYNNSKIEHKQISKEDIETDLKSFVEFEINKAAWQKSYAQKTIGNITIFECLEQKLPLKKITIIGDLNNPKSINVHFYNNNNLYKSTKIIKWIPNKSYSIFSIQDVKGMDADTLFVKTYLR